MASRLTITLFAGFVVAATAGGMTAYAPTWIEHGIVHDIEQQQDKARELLVQKGATPDTIDTEMRAIDRHVRAVSMSGSWQVSRRGIVIASILGFLAGAGFGALASYIWSVIAGARH